MGLLDSRFSLYELYIKDCLSKNQLPKIDRYDDRLFVNLQFPAIQKERNTPSLSQLSLLLDAVSCLLSVKIIWSLTEIFQNCKFDSNGYKQNIMGNSPDYLLHTIFDIFVEDLLHQKMKVFEI
ncbi:MAG: hypothetical protein MRJ97_02840 [Candidatus Nitrosocosmicus sp.]|jgi:magnesium transporter|nr:hypothetical protein [Candidatus Nitrosocosmicus sp.]